MAEVVRCGGASAVLAASIFHFKEFTLKETKQHLRDAGIPVRLPPGVPEPPK
jgi:cyclase